MAGVGADPAAALQHGGLARHARPGEAAGAGEHVEQAGVGGGEVELGDGLDELAPALGDDQFSGEQVLGEPGRLQQPAGDGEDRAHARRRAGRTGRRSVKFSGLMPLLRNMSRSSAKVRTASTSMWVVSMEARFLATHGPMKTTLMSGPRSWCSTRAMATMGETMGARYGIRRGWYLRTYETAAGHGVVMYRPSGFVLQELAVGVGHEVGAQGDLVDRIEAQGADHGDQRAGRDVGELGGEAGGHHGHHPLLAWSSPKARAVSSRTCLAFWLQTRRQLPQPMQRGWMTRACPSTTWIALAGHSRTQA